MRILSILVLLVLANGPAFAAEARKYAVLSLIGDVMLISQWVPSTGARLDPNTKELIPINEGVYDKAALLAVNGALKKLDPDSKPVLLFARERSLYEAQNRMLDRGGKPVEMLEHVRGLLAGTGATHLILLTKLRNEARLKMHDTTVGSGMLEGVGFYIDSSMETRSVETGASGKGLLAPFAYFRIELIDLARGTVVNQERIVASTSVSIDNSTAQHAWNALSGAQKVRTLQDLITRETTRVIPKLVEATP
jgi:hypothetical protein